MRVCQTCFPPNDMAFRNSRYGYLAEDEVFGDWGRRKLWIQQQRAFDTVSHVIREKRQRKIRT